MQLQLHSFDYSELSNQLISWDIVQFQSIDIDHKSNRTWRIETIDEEGMVCLCVCVVWWWQDCKDWTIESSGERRRHWMLMANGLLFSHSQLVRVFRSKVSSVRWFFMLSNDPQTQLKAFQFFNVNIQIEVGKSFKRNRWAVSGIFFRNDYIIQPTNTRRFD